MTNNITRTPEQQDALNLIKNALRPHVRDMLDEFADLLANVPDEDLSREIDKLGNCIKLAFDRVAPHVSESMRWSMPYGFTILLRERLT